MLRPAPGLRASLAILVAGTVLAPLAPPAAAAAPSPVPCVPWDMRIVAKDLGSLENLEPDGTGGLLLSATDADAILRLTPDGRTTPVATGMIAPGGLRVRGTTLYANTGDSFAAGIGDDPSGTIEEIDLKTGARRTWARGLTMPNGLAFLPDGSAVTSRDLGGDATGITRVPAAAPRTPQPNWAALPDTNGMELDPSGTWLYVAETFTLESALRRIRVADPRQVEPVARLGALGVPKGLDDLDVDGDGLVYVAANLSGEVLRVDPRDGTSCAIVSGLASTSAVKFGRGPGWSADRLLVVGFDGVVRALTPPPGLAVTPPAAPAATAPAAAPRARSCRPRVLLPRAARRLRAAVLRIGTTSRRLGRPVPRSVRITVARGRSVRPWVTGRDARGRRATVELRRLRCPAAG